MPEGHVVHRLAQAFAEHFVGHPVQASSPQGRFADGAAALHGRTLTGAEAWGKQMFLLFGPETRLRVHLGMYGMWRFAGPGLHGIGRRQHGHAPTAISPGIPDETEQDEDGHPLPRGAVRLRLSTPTHLADLSGPTACALQTQAEMAETLAQIGPDPLRPGARPGRAWDTISASRTAIGQLLMRQDVVAGIGNIYRAELLFRARLDPHTPGRALTRPQWDALWRDARTLLADGVRDGAIITTRPQHRPPETPAPDAKITARRMRKDGRCYVAFRTGEPCRVCGTPIRMEPMAGRKLYWCPTCQPASPLAPAAG